jgi:hypothetical protein
LYYFPPDNLLPLFLILPSLHFLFIFLLVFPFDSYIFSSLSYCSSSTASSSVTWPAILCVPDLRELHGMEDPLPSRTGPEASTDAVPRCSCLPRE